MRGSLSRKRFRRPSRGLVTDTDTSARLARIPQRDTGPELAVRQVAHALGHRFRVRNHDLPGSPDLANRRRRWAIFVHGCFWHAHAGCARATLPKRNRKFWEAKLAGNRARDQRAVEALERDGWRVVTVWECELSGPEGLLAVSDRLAAALAALH